MTPLSTFTKNPSSSFVTLPAPSLERFACKASSSALTVTPSFLIAAKSGSTTIALASPPSELTSATPFAPLRAGLMTKSSNSLFCFWLILPSTVNIKASPSGVVIGAMPPVTLFGNEDRAEDSFSETCALALYMSVPSLKSMVISAIPYLEVLLRSFWFSSPKSSASKGLTTLLSTSSGVIPGAFSIIFTCVDDISGKASIGILRNE